MATVIHTRRYKNGKVVYRLFCTSTGCYTTPPLERDDFLDACLVSAIDGALVGHFIETLSSMFEPDGEKDLVDQWEQEDPHQKRKYGDTLGRDGVFESGPYKVTSRLRNETRVAVHRLHVRLMRDGDKKTVTVTIEKTPTDNED